MKRNKESIEAGLSLFQQILMDVPGIGQEFEVSRVDFQAVLPEDESEAALARRRHFEWYLLERESKTLGAVPVHACMDAWNEAASVDVRDYSEALLHSFAGVFEVSAADSEHGMWLSDLFGLGEYPVESMGIDKELSPGDLIVGRLFPVGDGVYCMSLAASLYREPKLLKAVRRDLSSLRESRRGVMRIGQHEIERLFFEVSVQADGSNSDGVDLVRERASAESGMLQAGLDHETIKDVMIEIAKSSAAGDSGSVTRILNSLAFDEDVDLGQAQRALTSLWAAENDPKAKVSPTKAKTASEQSAERVEDVRAALAKFDQQKAAGADVEQLYEALNEELGIQDREDPDEVITLPDFPGVVGAIIEEFLWDVERTQGESVALSLGRIRLLADFGKDIGVFEELGRADVLDFAGRWILDEGNLQDSEDARACIHALREFCGWSQEQHSHPLRDECEGFLEPLSKSVPRLVMLHQQCVARTAEHKPMEVTQVNADQLTLLDEDQRERQVAVEKRLAEMVRTGDLLHARIKQEVIEVAACYPAELRKLLDFRSE